MFSKETKDLIEKEKHASFHWTLFPTHVYAS